MTWGDARRAGAKRARGLGRYRSVAFGTLVAGLAIFGAVHAAAVLPPKAYEDARRDAQHHIQIEIKSVSGPGWFSAYGRCVAKGDVVTVFRGDLEPGTWVWFPVDCVKARAEPPPGPQLWVSLKGLRQSKYAEVYLNGSGRYEVAAWQIMLVEEPTEQPRCPANTRGWC